MGKVGLLSLLVRKASLGDGAVAAPAGSERVRHVDGNLERQAGWV